MGVKMSPLYKKDYCRILKLLYHALITGIIIFFISCQSLNQPNSAKENTLAYNINHPKSKLLLKPELEEISGIYYFDKNTIACIQDENALIYFINTKNGDIIRQLDFGKDGDYEDIAYHEGLFYILKSNGHIYSFSDTWNTKVKAKEIKTPLNSKNDCEGLFYDESNNNLLIACKGYGGLKKDKNNDEKKSIFVYDLDKGELQKDPLFRINPIEILKHLETNAYGRFSRKLANSISSGSGLFKPSAIAIHPISGHIFVLAHIGKVLLETNSQGEIIHVYQLNPRIFKQAEGLCFDSLGNMYISNEWNGVGQANLLYFEYMNQEN